MVFIFQLQQVESPIKQKPKTTDVNEILKRADDVLKSQTANIPPENATKNLKNIVHQIHV